MTYVAPVYMGSLEPMKVGSIVDRYLDIAADLVAGETVATATYAVTDAAGTAVIGVVSAGSYAGTRADFRMTAPATAGTYTLAVTFTVSDGQSVKKEARFRVV